MMALRRHRRAVFARRCGFTLVELLVVVGVVGLLASLVLCAAQSARGAARWAQCLNRLRQMALACHNYEAEHGAFPSTRDGSYYGSASSSLSPHVFLMPYLDQTPLFRQIDLSENSTGVLREPRRSVRNAHVYRRHLPIFVCPDDPLAVEGATNYAGCFGVGPAGHSGTGAWVNFKAVRLSDFTDGLSNTALLSERLTGDRDSGHYVPWRDVVQVDHYEYFRSANEAAVVCRSLPAQPSEHYSWIGSSWLFGGFEHTWYDHILTPNSHVPDCAIGGSWGAFSARSFHSGSVNFALADGSARGVSANISLKTWRALGTRHWGDTVDEF